GSDRPQQSPSGRGRIRLTRIIGSFTCSPQNEGVIMALSAQQQEIKDEFIRLRGGWDAAWDAVLELDPEFMRAYARFSAVPWTKNHLDALTKEFLYIAIDAAATHLYVPGIRMHIRAALRLGATKAQIMEVLECTATLGIHATNIGVPILVEVLEEKGLRTGPAPLSAAQ